MDNGLPRVKIPASGIPKRADDRPFYFAVLKPRQRPAGGLAQGHSGSLRALEDRMLQEEQPPIPGLRLGALLGRGSFGRVMMGDWGPTHPRVAVKVSHLSAGLHRWT